MTNGLITSYGKNQLFKRVAGITADTILGYQLGNGTADALPADIALGATLTPTRPLDTGYPQITSGVMSFQITLDSTDELLDGKTISEIGIFMKDTTGAQTPLFSHIVFTGFTKSAGSEYVISFSHTIG